MPEYMSTQEVANAFGIDRTTIWRWVKKGKLQALPPIGGRVLFERTHVEEVMRANAQNRAA